LLKFKVSVRSGQRIMCELVEFVFSRMEPRESLPLILLILMGV
jgi:hypothetical protein